jgi:hypothetical protein
MVKFCCMFRSWDTSYVLWWSQMRRITWKPRFRLLATAVRVFVSMRNLFGDSWLIAAASASEGDNTREVQSPTLHGENPRSGLDWLCLTITLLKTLFYERWFSPGWRWRRLCTVSFLEASLLEKLDFWCCLGDVCIGATMNRPLQRDFSFLWFFLVMCIHMLVGHCIIVDLHNINIYSLSKNVSLELDILDKVTHICI